MATVYVDGRPYQMNDRQNLLHGCLSLGFDLPYFCWHPAMGSVGACRQCAVKQFKDEDDTRGKIVMACMTPSAEGTRISIHDPEAVQFRAAIIEGLMLNHPHDCPVCDEGGECHLQDMTVMTGHDYRRYRFDKRTFRNQDLGPFVNHEMNRCIQCYRCVRFYREYAGGADLNSFALRNIVFFGRDRDGVLESEFAGNLVEVCPTGVFTDKTLKRHYARKWDLQMAPSVCVHCGLGCNTTPGERYGQLRRIVNRYNNEINGYFLCDRGRFGYEFVNSSRRIREPSLDGEPVTADAARAFLRAVRERGRMIGIASPRASLESNFALHEMVGADHFFAGVPDDELRLLLLMVSILRETPARIASLRDVELSDAVLILGEDVTNTAPRMALSLRQSIRRQPLKTAERMRIPLWMDQSVRDALQDSKGPLYIAAVSGTRLDDVAARTYRAAPDDIARLGYAVSQALDDAAPAVQELTEGERTLAAEIAAALRDAEQPLIVAGPSLNSQAIIRAAASVARALSRAGKSPRIAFTAAEPNSIGLALMNPRPLGEALRAGAHTVVVVENDLYRRLRADAVTALFGAPAEVVALDSLSNRTTDAAKLVLPAATFAEGSGTYVNNEGRAQRFFRVFEAPSPIQESWRWLPEPGWAELDGVISAMCSTIPQLERAREAAPDASFRTAGEKVPREPHRYSGRTAMNAHLNVSEPKPPEDPDSALAFSMEGAPVQPPPALLPFFWSPGWNSIQSVNKFQDEIAGPLRGGPPGTHLIEQRDGAGDRGSPPQRFALRAGEVLVVPLYRIFGSEELSRCAPAVAEVASTAFIAMNPEDAAQIPAGDGAQLELLGLRLPLKVAPDVPRGIAGVTAGIPPVEGVPLPAWSAVSRV